MSAAKKISKARIQLLSGHPFWGTLALKLKLQEMDPALLSLGVPMATDGEHIYYDPSFVDAIPTDQLKTAIAHEIGHVMFLHAYRKGNRNKRIWNMAGDHVINLLLKESRFTPLTVNIQGKKVEWWLCDERFRGKTTEQVYEVLIKKEQRNNEQQQQNRNQKGKGKKGCGCGSVLEPKGKSSEQQNKARQAVKQMVAEAYMAAKMMGSMPAGLDRFIREMLSPKVSWRDELAEFVTENTKEDYCWMRPNRRYLHKGIILPSLYSETVGDVVVAIDTSASVSEKELQQALSELSSILQTVALKKVFVIYVDAAVARVEEYTKEDLPIMPKPAGFGGTSFVPAFEWVQKNDVHPACLIYFTDGECNWFPEIPDYPVLWGVFQHGERFEKRVPFGRVINIE